MWELDTDVKPTVVVGRPYSYAANIDDNGLFDVTTGQRKSEFSDTQLSANSTAMEEFWYVV